MDVLLLIGNICKALLLDILSETLNAGRTMQLMEHGLC